RADAARGGQIAPPEDDRDRPELSCIDAPREADVTRTNGSAPSSAVGGWALRHKPLVALGRVGVTAGGEVMGLRDLVGGTRPTCPRTANAGPGPRRQDR